MFLAVGGKRSKAHTKKVSKGKREHCGSVFFLKKASVPSEVERTKTPKSSEARRMLSRGGEGRCGKRQPLPAFTPIA